MSPDFATAVKETLTHPRCKGITFWPSSEGNWMVSIMIDHRSNASVHTDKNPMMALYKCLAEFERRLT